MKTRLLGFAVILVALAFIVNALALTSASITGTTLSANIVNSSAALIAIGNAGASQDPDVAFTDGPNASIAIEHGIQANSTYTFGQVFSVTSNSDEDVWVDVSVVGPGSGATVTLSRVGGGLLTNIPLPTTSRTVYFTMSVTAGAIPLSTTDFTITVTADKSGS